ncbi:hypothetical protein F5Y18DRAFT_364243 [Xylariaceae sp. FL1019]|nr:hypothetical protein F5Y18DRAFT_364243 [Xylariaceae sp. FL1019]
MAHSHQPWGNTPPPTQQEESGPQFRPMGLKVHYTFDRDSQDKCLARLPHPLHIQTIAMDTQTIGIVDLRICLQAVSHCSPELTGDGERDYAIYATDYSEVDTPLVGQGLLSQGLNLGLGQESKVVVGRVTQNVLAIFGNGVRETLEVKLKLTALPTFPRHERHDSISRPLPTSAPPPNLPTASSMISESSEWNNSFMLPQPGPSQRQSAPPMPMSMAPAAPAFAHTQSNPSFEARNNTPVREYPPIRPAPDSRPSSVGPYSMEPNTTTFIHVPSVAPMRQEDSSTTKSAKSRSQSRPNSRASSRAPTGNPRGRPRKRALASEGNTSGYEDGTDGDEGPSRAKKRATVTKGERGNTAAFGSAPESLRVAASTAGSIRNIRPFGPTGDAPTANNLQEAPRAPTPVPGPRFQGLPHQRPSGQSSLRRQSTTSPSTFVPNPQYLDANRSFSQDTRSPSDSPAPSPFSDEPSPADIGSSPPVPRSAMYSLKTSPAPSSPVLPPMPAPVSQPDSGFMSGGLDDNRTDVDLAVKPIETPVPVPIIPHIFPFIQTVPASKPKPKPRRRPAKKQALEPQPQSEPASVPVQNPLMRIEIPGPPESLPQTYSAQSPDTTSQPIVETPLAIQNDVTDSNNPPRLSLMIKPEVVGAETREEAEGCEPEVSERTHRNQMQTEQPQVQGPQVDFTLLEAALKDYPNNQDLLETLGLGGESFGSNHGAPTEEAFCAISPSSETESRQNAKMDPPALPTLAAEPSVEPELPDIPASDPILPRMSDSLPMSETLHPQTDAVDGMDSRMNKNFVKRQAIKQKLEEAVAAGQLPSFCSNCGALQTPTWRKIWKQEHRGVPAYHDYSEKPGHVTAINVLERDEDGTPTSYETIKKSLGPTDDKTKWTEVLLCNPCGIWFSKWKSHRPPEKWEKDGQRLTQTRKKRAGAGGASRPRKSRAKSDSQMSLTSEACLATDSAEPPDAPNQPDTGAPSFDQNENASEQGSGRNRKRIASEAVDQGSTHSRANRAGNSAISPITLDDELGGTRRLLFPSPRKEGEQKILGEVAVNIVQTGPKTFEFKDDEGDEKKIGVVRNETPEPQSNGFVDLFGPTPRPSTPPPRAANSGPFKTPTRPTPSHRPITRSVSKSLRCTGSPGQRLLDRTPTRTPKRTPRSAFVASGLPRRSPRHLCLSDAIGGSHMNSPMSQSISQMMSDGNHLLMHTPTHGFDLDFGSLGPMDNIDHFGDFDFSLLNTDPLMPSSPPLRDGGMMAFGGNLTFDTGHESLTERNPKGKRPDGIGPRNFPSH